MSKEEAGLPRTCQQQAQASRAKVQGTRERAATGGAATSVRRLLLLALARTAEGPGALLYVLRVLAGWEKEGKGKSPLPVACTLPKVGKGVPSAHTERPPQQPPPPQPPPPQRYPLVYNVGKTITSALKRRYPLLYVLAANDAIDHRGKWADALLSDPTVGPALRPTLNAPVRGKGTLLVNSYKTLRVDDPEWYTTCLRHGGDPELSDKRGRSLRTYLEREQAQLKKHTSHVHAHPDKTERATRRASRKHTRKERMTRVRETMLDTGLAMMQANYTLTLDGYARVLGAMGAMGAMRGGG